MKSAFFFNCTCLQVKQIVQNNPKHCSPFYSHRNVLTVLLFIARAFISGGFQAAYVYTPEVRRLVL